MTSSASPSVGVSTRSGDPPTVLPQHRLDHSFLAEQLQGARSYRRIAGYFTSSLFEIAHEWLEPIPDVRIVCNVDLSPEDLKVAQVREARMLGRWNERYSRVAAEPRRSRLESRVKILSRRHRGTEGFALKRLAAPPRSAPAVTMRNTSNGAWRARGNKG